jgi:hypothetical protein
LRRSPREGCAATDVLGCAWRQAQAEYAAGMAELDEERARAEADGGSGEASERRGRGERGGERSVTRGEPGVR